MTAQTLDTSVKDRQAAVCGGKQCYITITLLEGAEGQVSGRQHNAVFVYGRMRK